MKRLLVPDSDRFKSPKNGTSGKNSVASKNLESNFHGFKKITALLTILALPGILSGCVGSSVQNTLDVAALESPDNANDDSLQDLALADGISDPAAKGAIPVPARSPLTSQTALVSPVDENAAVTATNELIADQTGSGTQLASIQADDSAQVTQNATGVNNADTAIQAQSVSAKQNNATPKKQKSGGLLGFLFGKKQKPAKVAALRKKPKSKTSITSVPSKQALDNALPGVKSNSVLFGLDEGSNKGDNVQVASVGLLGRTMSPTGLLLQTEKVQVDCFKPGLMRILAGIERKYGKKVMVTSGYRSPKRNRLAGGAKHSMHMYCKAADIQVEGVSKWDLAKYLRSVPGRGGVGTYCRTKSVHIDIGPKRDWHYPCRRGKRKKRA